MGIPSYFSFIVKNHPKIIKRFNASPVSRLYLDCNSILYEAVHTIDFSGWTAENSFPKTTIIILPKNSWFSLIETQLVRQLSTKDYCNFRETIPPDRQRKCLVGDRQIPS